MRNQRGLSFLIILIGFLLLMGVVSGIWMVFKSNSSTASPSPTPTITTNIAASQKPTSINFSPLPSPSESSKPSVLEQQRTDTSLNGAYKNPQFKFEFDLKSGERGLACPDDPLPTVFVLVTVTTEPTPPSGVSECARGGPISDYIHVTQLGAYDSVSSVDAHIIQLESPENGYSIQKTPLKVSGVSGFRLVGSRDPDIPAPIADNIDVVAVIYNGFFYEFDSKFLQRNFRFIP